MDCAVPGSGATNGGDHDELDVDDPSLPTAWASAWAWA
jgi:hypothetical protein